MIDERGVRYSSAKAAVKSDRTARGSERDHASTFKNLYAAR